MKTNKTAPKAKQPTKKQTQPKPLKPEKECCNECGPIPCHHRQLVVVINGRSSVGKHTLIEHISNYYEVRNVSSVTPIKDAAMNVGWDGIKDEAGRRLLGDLKATLVRYNDSPTKYVVGEYKKFVAVEQDIMFVHIREPEEIAKFRRIVPCKTLLVLRDSAPQFNNLRTDNEHLLDFDYDFAFDNSGTWEQSAPAFLKLIEKMRCLTPTTDLPLEAKAKRV